MGDMADTFRAMDEVRKQLRSELGQSCPECQRLLPKAHPKILLPQGWCRMHKYRDPRPSELVDDFHGRLADETEASP